MKDTDHKITEEAAIKLLIDKGYKVLQGKNHKEIFLIRKPFHDTYTYSACLHPIDKDRKNKYREGTAIAKINLKNVVWEEVSYDKTSRRTKNKILKPVIV